MGALVAWYGLYQAGHLVFNLRYLFDPGVPPFPAPAEGWSAQLAHLLNGMAGDVYVRHGSQVEPPTPAELAALEAEGQAAAAAFPS